MITELINRYAKPLPRYTSYPTANQFTDSVGTKLYADWLADIPSGDSISAYVHIPFCQEMCWYCGCSTKAVRQYRPIAEYLTSLLAEIENVASNLSVRNQVSHLHWGGGSPNMLSATDISRLSSEIRTQLNVSTSAEFAIEVDPRGITQEKVAAFADAGVTRVSVGVQDFNCQVQNAINRRQSFGVTKAAIDLFRHHGIEAINIDLVYGLPHQTRQSVDGTIKDVLKLAPNRIAIFGYAHLPRRIKHQRLIDQRFLPDAIERYGQSSRLARILETEGYARVGLDHFARSDDPLAVGRVGRNFQGYTTDAAETLIGFGASAIGSLPQGYVQNAVPVAQYAQLITEHGLATVRGVALTDDDRARRFAIERLMCDFTLSISELEHRFGEAATALRMEAETLLEIDHDELVERTDDGIAVTERGRPFVRTIASCFDSYLDTSKGLHAVSV